MDEIFAGSEYSGRTGILVSDLPLLKINPNASDEKKAGNDLVNTKLIYGNLSELTPYQAGDRLLWTHLAHVQYFSYVKMRWKNAVASSQGVEDRFFLEGGRPNLFTHAIARLWWYGYLTYDSSNSENPWELTETLLLTQQSCKDLLDESYSNNRTVMKGMLQALKIFAEERGTAGVVGPWRQCVKHINRFGAVTVLDFLTADEIRREALEFLRKQ
jgi:hypothetical protein